VNGSNKGQNSMWMIRWFLIVVIVVFVSLFIGNNHELPKVSINYLFGETEEISPLLIMFFAYLAGFLTWFIISLFNFFKMRSDLAAKDKLIRNLKQELNGYRNQALALDEDKTMIFKKSDVSALSEPMAQVSEERNHTTTEEDE